MLQRRKWRPKDAEALARATKGWSHAFYFSWLWMASFQLQGFTKLTNFPKFILYGIFRLFPLFITFCIFQNFCINFTKQLVHYSLISLIAVMAAIKLIVAATQNMYLDEQNTVFSASALFPLFRKPESRPAQRLQGSSWCENVQCSDDVWAVSEHLRPAMWGPGEEKARHSKGSGEETKREEAKGVFSVSHTKLCS